jgi:hypothetical protein
MVAQVGYSVAGRSRGQVAPCVVRTVHVEMKSAGFLVEPQTQGGGGFLSLGLKTGSSGLVIWASKSPRRFSWFGPQNQASFSLSFEPQNQRREVGMGHASRSSGLLHVEASLAMISQSDLKTDGGATPGGARGTIDETGR